MEMNEGVNKKNFYGGVEMKYCSNCDAQLKDDTKICTWCGCTVDEEGRMTERSKDNSGKKIIIQYPKENEITVWAKVFMVLGTIVNAFVIIPLLWCLPMTIYFFVKVKNREVLGVGFKICSLIFVSPIAGILMLCDKEF